MIEGIHINSMNIMLPDNKKNKNNNKNNQNDNILEIYNDNENENDLLLSNPTPISNKNPSVQTNIYAYKQEQLSKKNEVFIAINPVIPKKTEDKIICFSRRRKMPKNTEDLSGYLMTLSFFILFTILITICLSNAKNKPNISDTLKTIYNWLFFFIWLTSILSMICLSDAAWADPGRQRGTPISKVKFDGNRIKKIVGGQKYALKYCTTCHLIRDVRTFHCNTCGLCIEKHDHHCGYLSNCVGVYNYKKFFIFLVVACIHVSIMFITSVHYIFFCQGNNEEDEGYEWITILMTVITVFGGFFEFFTVWMVIQHIVTIVQNRTTREFIKNKEYGIYNKGCRENCKEALCSNEIKEL